MSKENATPWKYPETSESYQKHLQEMDPEKFYSLYQQEPYIPTLDELADEYQRRCEEYDLTVCTSIRDGEAVPSNGRESALICDNARRILSEICRREGVSETDLMKAIRAKRD